MISATLIIGLVMMLVSLMKFILDLFAEYNIAPELQAAAVGFILILAATALGKAFRE